MTTGKKQARPVSARRASGLDREIRAVLETAGASAYRAVNTAMVQAYWHVGRLIVEHEQGGRRRAVYGEALLDDLSRRLTADFGRGFTVANLRYRSAAERNRAAARDRARATPHRSTTGASKRPSNSRFPWTLELRLAP